MPASSEIYDQLCRYARETSLLSATAQTLGWDERTQMPPAAGAFRADQMTFLAGLIHRRQTDSQYGQWLEQLADSDLAADPHSDSGTVIRQLKRDYDKNVKLPQRLVEELARATSLGEQAWVEARRANDFARFRPHLETIVRLTCEKADAIGWTERRYDALLDDYEPHARTSEVTQVLAGLRDELVPLVEAIVGSGRRPDDSILKRRFPAADQKAFGARAASAIGFDFNRGRLDETAHPFCTGLGPNDCRITTRYDEHFFPGAFFGILHEAGHGIYDQGLRTEWFGLPPGEAVSLGIHESQSRMWENFVGRSRAFWRYFYGQAQRTFDSLADVPLEAFHFAINDVRPSLIRVEADELTYNLHILIRFELEQALSEGELTVGDLTGAWREKYQSYLGIEPPNDADGVMQDVHWSAGLIGYFPTYSLGNLYAAQFFQQADQELGGLHGQFAKGEFQPLREWLVRNIHQPGQCYTATELVERVTGKPLSHQPLMEHLKSTFGPLYGIE